MTGNQAAATGGGMAITPLLIPEVTLLALVFGIGIGAVFLRSTSLASLKAQTIRSLKILVE